VWFGLNGSDAVECALKLALIGSGRSRIIAVDGAFHGKTLGALSVTDRARLPAALAGCLLEVVRVPPSDLRRATSLLSEGDIAAFVFEPVQGEAGARVLDMQDVAFVANACHEAGAAVIADEIQCGFGRCGEYSVALGTNVPLDALLLGKPLGGGVMPLSAVLGTEEFFAPLVRDPFLHSSTFSGHPLSCAAGHAALDLLEECLPHIKDLEVVCEQRLRRLAELHPGTVDEVAGKGLMWGLTFNTEKLAHEILAEAAHRGILLGPSVSRPDTLRVLPSAVMSASELGQALAVLTDVCTEARAK
jgi:putrescine aminotransferase